MKIAAAEALWHTEDPASFSLLTVGDLSQRNEVFSIRIPFALSLLATDQLSGEVKGIYDLQAEYEATFGPGNYIPPVAVIYWTFRIMVGAGMAMVALGFYALFMVMGDTIKVGSKTQKIFFVGRAGTGHSTCYFRIYRRSLPGGDHAAYRGQFRSRAIPADGSLTPGSRPARSRPSLRHCECRTGNS